MGELSDGRLVILTASPDQTETFSYEMAVFSHGLDERAVLSSISNLTGTFFLKVMLQADDHLVDWEAGKCFFDSSEQAALNGKSAWKWLYENGNATTEDAELTKYF